MKHTLATIAVLSTLFALACAPVDTPPTCDAAGYDAAETDAPADAGPAVRVYVAESWPSKYAFYIREGLRNLEGITAVEVDTFEAADVGIYPTLPHAEDCRYGTGTYTRTIYLDWDCYERPTDMTDEVHYQLWHMFGRLTVR